MIVILLCYYHLVQTEVQSKHNLHTTSLTTDTKQKLCDKTTIEHSTFKGVNYNNINYTTPHARSHV